MSVVTARLLFLAFLVMTATIIYNALYLQGQAPHSMANVAPETPAGYAATRIIGIEPQEGQAQSAQPQPDQPGTLPGTSVASSDAAAPVVTDLPAAASGGGESQLVVRAIQRELSLRGYDVGAVDGQLSDKTRKAISAFQMREGLSVTGLPSDDVLRQILLGDTIGTSEATGSIPDAATSQTAVGEGVTVLRVQQVLSELGYAPGPIDGAWGQNTAQALSAFQRDRDLAVTGSITPETLAEFQRVTGRDFTRTAARR